MRKPMNLFKTERPALLELKNFAITMGWAIPALLSLLLPWIFNKEFQYWPLYLSAILALFYFVYPMGIYPVYRVWTLMSRSIGWINTRVILALIFYIIILPSGVLLKMFGKLQYRSYEPKAQASYWKTRETHFKNTDLERPF